MTLGLLNQGRIDRVGESTAVWADPPGNILTGGLEQRLREVVRQREAQSWWVVGFQVLRHARDGASRGLFRRENRHAAATLALLLAFCSPAWASTSTTSTSTSTVTTTTCPPPPLCLNDPPITIGTLPGGIVLKVPAPCSCSWGEVWDEFIRTLNTHVCFDTRCRAALAGFQFIGGSPAPGKVVMVADVETIEGEEHATFEYGNCPSVTTTTSP